MKLSQGDTVIVISGKDKGKKGTILRVLRSANRVVVGDVNLVTKHIKKTSQSEGKTVRFEASINASKVMIADPKTGKPTRIGYRIDEKTGKKVRYAKASGSVLGRVKAEQKDAQVKEVKQPKVEQQGAPKKDATAKTAEAAATTKRAPFWKKIGFGSEAMADSAEAGQKPENAPAQSTQVHSRSGSRGS